MSRRWYRDGFLLVTLSFLLVSVTGLGIGLYDDHVDESLIPHDDEWEEAIETAGIECDGCSGSWAGVTTLALLVIASLLLFDTAFARVR